MARTTTPEVITLGTAGGPRVWLDRTRRPVAAPRCGIATAIVVGKRWYLVDAGHGTYTQIRRAGLDLNRLAGVFITHLHSDHTIDLNSLTVYGMYDFTGDEFPVIPIIGPGDRGELPPISARALTPPTPVFPEDPTPGTVTMFRALMYAHATDLNDRILDALRPSPLDLWRPRDIAIPATAGYSPNANPTPSDCTPWVIFEDEAVRVSATLVQHPPIAPAFGFRFDIEAGGGANVSVTISGDTVPCDNLVRLAEGTTLLLHEAIDFDWVHALYPGDSQLERASRDHHHKSHSSPAGAGEIAQRAGARTLALHHLVPGNADRAVFEAAGGAFGGPVIVPDDLARLDLTTGRVIG